jgi:nucleoside-diphosphate-sugar epimerase
MKILITGNLGYIGTELSRYLKKKYPNYGIIGYDTAFFEDCFYFKRENSNYLSKQIKSDMRNFKIDFLQNVDSVIHLAAISNDPIGATYEKQTFEINYLSSKRLLDMCVQAKVKNFVFASSCSMYGSIGSKLRNEKDELNPLTEYARSKVGIEKYISEIDTNITKTTSLRFSTACGISDRLRLDLVLNDFVFSALQNNKIKILSDGKPWRPLIDVEDMCKAIDWSLHRSLNEDNKNLSINTGSDENNIQICDLAEEVSKILNVKIELNKDNKSDNRSYKVDFSLYKKMCPENFPLKSIKQSINELADFYKNSDNKLFMWEDYIRLNTIKKLIQEKKINNELYWTN